MIDDLPSSFELGDWLIEPGLNRLTNDGVSVQVEPKTMAVLTCLWRSRGEAVSSDQIISEVWGGRPMGDNPIYKSIAKLRQALGDDKDNPRYIATVSKKGYRLLPAEKRRKNTTPQKLASRALQSNVRRSLPVTLGVIIGAAIAALIFWRPPITSPTLRSLSTFSGSHLQPSLAPDGERIAFVNDDGGASHIWILDPKQTGARQLTSTDAPDARPRWSPDGESVLFVRGNSVWTIPSIGGEATVIIRDGQNPNWSRDGKQIVFERRYEIWIADADGSSQERVAGVPRRELNLAPRWPAFSPDGKQLVYFDSDTTPMGDLWTISLSGGPPKQLTFFPAFGGTPVWSPDGQSVVYSSQRSGSRTLWSVDVATRTSTALLTGSGDDNYPDFSSDGAQVAYSNSRETYSIILSDPQTGDHQELFQSRQILVAPELSADRKTIAFFGAARSGGVQIFTMPLSGGIPNMVTTDPLATNVMPKWSADGATLYFFRTLKTSSFCKVDSNGGPTQQLIKDWDWNIANGANVDPRDETVVYSRLTGQTPVQTSLRNLITMEDQSFYATLEYPRWSNDGLNIIGSAATDQRFPGDIAVCPINDESCRIIATSARIPVYSADESLVYFVRGFGQTQELFVTRSDGVGDEKKLMVMAPLHPLGPFYDITSDGSVVWIRREQERSEIWLMER